ncbi:Golgi-associated plant pathogenesis-related protein 1-like [Amphiura filiformis]|uniref:Golgi-associated plant pathogenesis-related protein 1-like n=1 Tax=Amphiura filiformis TaxID=82378 RepID=UPI003B21A031
MGKCMSRSDDVGAYRSKFRRDALKAHNDYRKKHGAGTLKLTGNLNKYAQQWADKCAKSSKLQHRTEHKYGENIHFASDSRGIDGLTGDKAVKAFYDECQKYSYNTTQHIPGTGHFTQTVWKDSKRLGIGVAVKNNQVFAIFNYDPPGNVGGKYKDNVKPPK